MPAGRVLASSMLPFDPPAFDALPGARWFGAVDPAADTMAGLRLSAPAASDWFHDPTTGERKRNAPMLLAPVTGPAILRARVQVDFRATFDAGVLMVYESDASWAKFCFERDPTGRHLAVSVVTRDESDDANGFAVPGDALHVRVAHLGASFAFHASEGGERWELIRHFRLGGAARVWMGVGVQSPLGAGCVARFEHVMLTAERLADLRDGR